MTKQHFNLLIQHLTKTLGHPSLWICVSPRESRLKFAESEQYAALLLTRLERKLMSPRGRRSAHSSVLPTILLGESKTKQGNPCLVHFHGLSWCRDVNRFTKEIQRQSNSVSSAFGFCRRVDVQCERFDPKKNGVDYISKHINENDAPIAIGPHSQLPVGIASTS